MSLRTILRGTIGTPLERPIRWLWMGYLRLTNRSYYERQVKSQTHDRLLAAVLDRILERRSCCVDVGAYYGAVLTEIIKRAPEGRHHAFEPITELAERLARRFPSVQVHTAAAGKWTGPGSFYFVRDYPAQSGFRTRPDYPSPVEPEKRTIRVERLDDALANVAPIDFIKLDAEGAEYEIMVGAEHVLRRHRPVLAFEFGRAAENHGVSPAMVWDALVSGLGYRLYLPEDWLEGSAPLDPEALRSARGQGASFYLAVPA